VFSLLGQNFWDIIHYSGHAFFDTTNPENSGLVLSDSIISA
jgi:CHAT domain-containing protein